MLPLALALIKTKNRHLLDPLHWSENAHFTLDLRVFNGWRQFSIKKGKKDGDFLFQLMPEPMVIFLELKNHTFPEDAFFETLCTWLGRAFSCAVLCLLGELTHFIATA